jgi:hypothetical protein
MGGFSRWSVGAGFLTAIPAVGAHAPPIDFFVTTGDGRNESQQGGQENLPGSAIDLLELLEHEPSQELSNENKNGEPLGPPYT